MGLFGKKNKDASKSRPIKMRRHKFVQGVSRDLDAVVFVHGFKGHYLNTWGKFPALVDEDPDLPALDILNWGYPTGFRPLRPGIDKVGEQLITTIKLRLPNAKRIVVVAHSMGGVVTLSGITTEMAAGRAQDQPTGLIDRVVFFASPIKGEHIATAAKHLFGGLLYVTRVMNAQVRQLADGDFCRALESAVVNNVYRPKSTGTHSRPIPIHVCLGRKDKVVIESTARGVIEDPGPESFEEGHESIKLPTDRDDLRYLGLKRPLEKMCSRWFHERLAITADASNTKSRIAADELRRNLQHGIDARLSDAFKQFSQMQEAERRKLREQLLVISYRIGLAATGATIGSILNGAIIELSELRA